MGCPSYGTSRRSTGGDVDTQIAVGIVPSDTRCGSIDDVFPSAVIISVGYKIWPITPERQRINVGCRINLQGTERSRRPDADIALIEDGAIVARRAAARTSKETSRSGRSFISSRPASRRTSSSLSWPIACTLRLGGVF